MKPAEVLGKYSQNVGPQRRLGIQGLLSLLSSSGSGPGGLGSPAFGPFRTLYGTLRLPSFLGGLLGSWSGIISSCFPRAGPLDPFGLRLLRLPLHRRLPRSRGLLVQPEGAGGSGALGLDKRSTGHQAFNGGEDSGFVRHHVVSTGLQSLLQGCQGHAAALRGRGRGLQDPLGQCGTRFPLLRLGSLPGSFGGGRGEWNPRRRRHGNSAVGQGGRGRGIRGDRRGQSDVSACPC